MIFYSKSNIKPVSSSLSVQIASIWADCSGERKFFQSPTVPLRKNMGSPSSLVALSQDMFALLSFFIFSKLAKSAILEMILLLRLAPMNVAIWETASSKFFFISSYFKNKTFSSSL